MKQLIIPIVIGLLAGLGGGTGYSYMKTSAKYTADSTQLADSLKAHPPADSTHADSTDGAASHGDAAAHDSVAADSVAHGMDSPGVHEAAPPPTPADSIRLLDAARRAKSAPAPVARTTPSVKSPTPSVANEKSTTSSAAAVVKEARDAAMSTALPEQRLAKIFSAMAAKDAAKVLDQMTDGDVRTILGMMNDRQAAAVLTAMSATRAAAITKGGGKAPGGPR
ncbi:magnesium transporter MgtE N-terminal domain-containing protein [Gemmatimonas sp.]|jgi:hypothetical protein|uniref:MotE family protein n=1 Tax=Gemmatimonas sp. TaxID=1962908 RepID=UPI0037C15499